MIMQTFLPRAGFWSTARVLDNKRLGKQRVECKQILLALGIDVGDHPGNPESRWRNHPAVRMWAGYEVHLAEYAYIMCRQWQARGFRDTLAEQFRHLIPQLPNGPSPNWLGYDRLHASHRSNLLRKDPSHYGQFGWQESPDLAYFWPPERQQKVFS